MFLLILASHKTTPFHPFFSIVADFAYYDFTALYFIEIIDIFRVLYRDLLFYAVYGFLKWEMIRCNGFTTISYFIFVFTKFGGRIYTNFLVFLELFE